MSFILYSVVFWNLVINAFGVWYALRYRYNEEEVEDDWI